MTFILILSGAITLLVAATVARVAGLHLDSARPTGWRAWSALLCGHAAIGLVVAGMVAAVGPAAWLLAVVALLLAATWGLLHHRRIDDLLRDRLGPSEPSLPLERHGYGNHDLRVLPGDRLAWKTIAETHLKEGGIVVLGLDEAGGEYEGVPGDPKLIRPGDRLVLYGPATRLHELLKHRRFRPDRSNGEGAA